MTFYSNAQNHPPPHRSGELASRKPCTFPASMLWLTSVSPKCILAPFLNV